MEQSKDNVSNNETGNERGQGRGRFRTRRGRGSKSRAIDSLRMRNNEKTEGARWSQFNLLMDKSLMFLDVTGLEKWSPKIEFELSTIFLFRVIVSFVDKCVDSFPNISERLFRTSVIYLDDNDEEQVAPMGRALIIKSLCNLWFDYILFKISNARRVCGECGDDFDRDWQKIRSRVEELMTMNPTLPAPFVDILNWIGYFTHGDARRKDYPVIRGYQSDDDNLRIVEVMMTNLSVVGTSYDLSVDMTVDEAMQLIGRADERCGNVSVIHAQLQQMGANVEFETRISIQRLNREYARRVVRKFTDAFERKVPRAFSVCDYDKLRSGRGSCMQSVFIDEQQNYSSIAQGITIHELQLGGSLFAPVAFRDNLPRHVDEYSVMESVRALKRENVIETFVYSYFH